MRGIALLGLVTVALGDAVAGCSPVGPKLCDGANAVSDQIRAAWDADGSLDRRAAVSVQGDAVPCNLSPNAVSAIAAARKAAGSTKITDYAALCQQYEDAASACG